MPFKDGSAGRSVAKVEQWSLEHREILELLPHRPPFLFLDRVIQLTPGKSGRAIKNVTVNEAFLGGHFPDDPVMPGFLTLEACAQLGAVIMAAANQSETGRPRAAVGYLAGVESCKFLRLVRPGDQLLLSVDIGRQYGQLLALKTAAYCVKSCVAKAQIMVTMQGDGTMPDRSTPAADEAR